MADERQINQESNTESPFRSHNEILFDMAMLDTRVGIFSEGVYYLIEHGAPEEIVSAYSAQNEARAATFIADKLGFDDKERARIMNRETRTVEEQDYIQKLLLQMSAFRQSRYFKSNYFESIGFIADEMETLLEVQIEKLKQPEFDSFAAAINTLARFYFVQLHRELDPLSGEPLSLAEEGELRNLVHKYIAFHQSQSKKLAESVIDFIFPTMGEITELSGLSDKTFLPTSLIWRDQQRIGLRGADGAMKNVGKHTEAGKVLVEAHISDKDGNPLSVDLIMQGVEAAIGQLIDENGRRLPIIVTPQQVYRAYARLPNNAPVTAQQAAEMERAMDKLMFAPSRLDFTAQLEKHTRIKQQSDYDYTDKNAGRLTGNLLIAEKGEGVNRLGERQVAYKIYEYPMLYRYSHIVGQIAQVPTKLITGDDKDAVKETKTAEAQRNALNMGMRRNVLTRITYWRSRYNRHKPMTPALLIQEVAEDGGITLTEKTEKTLRKNIRLYLDELKAQGTRNGGIKNYIPQKDGRHIVGFYIEF